MQTVQDEGTNAPQLSTRCWCRLLNVIACDQQQAGSVQRGCFTRVIFGGLSHFPLTVHSGSDALNMNSGFNDVSPLSPHNPLHLLHRVVKTMDVGFLYR